MGENKKTEGRTNRRMDLGEGTNERKRMELMSCSKDEETEQVFGKTAKRETQLEEDRGITQHHDENS